MSSAPDIPTITDILNNLELADGSNLDKKQVSKLLKLRRDDNSPLITIESVDLLSNIVSMIDKLGFPDTYRYLKDSVDMDDIDIIFNSPIFIDVRRSNFIEKTKDMVIKRITHSIHTCKDCGSKNVEVTVVQTRSSDEGASVFYKCKDCDKKW